MMSQVNFTLGFEKLKGEVLDSGLNDVVKTSLVLILNQYWKQSGISISNQARMNALLGLVPLRE
ncbi:hypothetical protein SAMN05216231_3171 [Virgibacillus salinus]|uniref:Uncharacterized protein n=1 Tax=Virgibacillus salinus TaxID=553311 RepID=A0A1H1F276_9BACI|nr:hypothetical protein SAMN05216231_3171 [Virgibacillus salinus]